MLKLKKEINASGLELEAIENFSPGDWYDVLLDGPKREEQMINLKQIIRNVGRVGIPIIGYNFSLAGVYGHTRDRVARGNAVTVKFDESDQKNQALIPEGQIWNMTYDLNKGDVLNDDAKLESVTSKDLWKRLRRFLEEITPLWLKKQGGLY